ncbi:hypothetical protein K466DRAFT_663993 [Polyporus arcularius HHB13444]|uniref:Uncharacterized protein n=1 Tax=Polyporus arcularius HHB13444 TaxID=1314778 RepID=A0A5C3PB28_9APHY|nr:hypothetical protein K466DRAFT_663993 [Polyporus arcularius HHB13444]
MSVAPVRTFPLSECRLKLTIRDDPYFSHVRKDISVKASHPQHGCVGTLYAHRINKSFCQDRGDFHQIMDISQTDDLLTFATTLFDKRGQLKPELTANEYLKGTGAFGHELNSGILLVVVTVRVPPEFRGRGIASHLLSALANSPHGAEATAIIACPRPIERIADREVWERKRSIATNLLLKNSYRRIGRTCFLAYATDSKHPSRSISIEDDQEPARFGGTLISGQAGHAYDDDEWLYDPTLHDAALCAYLPAVRALLALPLKSHVLDELFSRDNAEGLTPLEACEQHQRSLREEEEVDLLRLWKGHKPTALRVIYLLKRAMGEDLGMSEDEFVCRYRWGCTCEHCSDGWLSPRMRYTLSYIAAGNIDRIHEAAEHCTLPNTSCDDEPSFQHFPPTVQKAGILTAAFCKAYANITRAIDNVLHVPGVPGIPTVDNVNAMLGGSANTFFRKGGRVEHALGYILTTAAKAADVFYMSQLPQKAHTPRRLADQSDEFYEIVCHFVAVWSEDDWDTTIRDLKQNAEYAALPACDNDLNFALVALKLGLDEPARFLPPPRPCSPECDLDCDDSDLNSDSETGSGGSESADEDEEEVDENMEASEGEDDDEDCEDSDDSDDSDEDEGTYKEPPRKRMRV